MSKFDISQRFLLRNRNVRGVFVRLHESYADCLKNHEYPQMIQQFLGEFVCAGALMTSLLKMDVCTTIQAKGKGDVSLLAVEITPDATLRATVKYNQDANYTTVNSFRELLGEGHLAIIIQPQDKNKENYQGIVELSDGGVADIFEQYFHRSEQLSTVFVFKQLGDQIAGLMLQVLPDIEFDEDYWLEVQMLLKTISTQDLLFDDTAHLLKKLWPQEDINLYDETPLRFSCSCSQERMHNAIRLLDYQELIEMVAENKSFDVRCDFCGENYLIEAEIIQTFAEEAKLKQVLH